MEKQTYKYIDVLQIIVDSYNNTPHQSLGGSTPSSVTKNNEDENRFIQYCVRKTKHKELLNKKRKKRTFYKFKIGDFVRISHLKRVFEKGYQEEWTMEFFKISKRYKRGKQDVYLLIDILGDPIRGTFYKYELHKIDKADIELYMVDKIIKERKMKGKQPEVLVKWLGWPSKFNSWIPKNDVKDI